MIHTDGCSTIACAPLECDLYVRNEGTIFTFTPVSRGARDWLAENVSEDAQWLGGTLCVEHRYAFDLADGLLDAGFAIK